MKKYITAILLIAYIPYICWLYVKKYRNQLLMGFTGVMLVAIIIAFACHREKVELNIVDVQAAFNKGTMRAHTDYIVIHHTAGDEHGKISDIARIHMKENRWNSIGYHYFIASDGVVYQLRNDRESEVPHAIGYNDNCVAICICGNFSEKECPSYIWNIALELTRKMMERYHVDAKHVLAHRELPGNQTECCGSKFDIDKFRDDL